MKGKNVWRTRYPFYYNELDGVAEFLEDKLANGWEMTHLTGTSFGFRKTEPRRAKINIGLVDDGYDESAKAEFIEYCQADGWNHFFDAGKLQFFENENLDAEPMYTDEEAKLDLVYRKCRGVSIGLNLSAAVLAIVFFILLFTNLNFLDYANCGIVVNLIMMPIAVAMLLYECISFCRWYRKSKKAVAFGHAPVYKRTKLARCIDRIIYVWCFSMIWMDDLLGVFYSKSPTLALMLLMFAGGTFLFIFLFGWYHAEHNKDGKRHLVRYFVIGLSCVAVMTGISYWLFLPGFEKENSQEPLFSVKEMGIESDGTAENWVYHEGSPLAKWENGEDRLGSKKIYYDFYETKYQRIYDQVVQEKYFDENTTHNETVDQAFGANKVYIVAQSTWMTKYLLLYDDVILFLETNIDLTDKQKEMIGEKVKAEVK